MVIREKMSKSIRLIWAIASIAMLCMFVIVCRFILFDMHGMKELPVVLMLIGLVVIAIAIFPFSKK